MRLKTFKHLALVSALAAALAACGGSNGSDPTATSSARVDDSALAWIDQPASIKWEGADAEAAAALKHRRGNRRNSDTGNGNGTTTDTSTNTGSTTTDGTSGGSSTPTTTDSGSSTDSTNTGSTGSGSTTTNSNDAGSSNSTSDSGGTTTGNGSTGATDTTNNGTTDNASTPTATASNGSGPAGASAGAYGSVTFDEEWNGSLDESKWSTRMPHWGSHIPELDNWKIENGQLKIWTPKMENGEFLFENRAMVTHDKFNQKYGWFEMEAKLPPGKGMWPSFWLYGIYGQNRPEIDIMESHGGVDEWWGDPNPIDYGATVWLGQLNGNHELLGMVRPTHYGIEPQDLTKDFHKYGALWEPDGVTFFFDGRQFGDKIRSSQLNDELWIIVGLGTGRPGDYNGPTAATPTDSEFVINYVRAWALPDGQTTVNGRTVR